MKRIMGYLILLLSILPFTESNADSFVVTEAKLLLLAAASAKEPEGAAAVDALVLFTIPTSPEFPSATQKAIAYAGLGALALYNYRAKDEGYTEDDIFKTNLVMFNIVLAGDFLGFNDSASKFDAFEEIGSSFNFQLSRAGEPRFNWRYQFD